MIDFPARLMLLLLTTALASGVMPERTWAQETPSPAETVSVSDTASSPAQSISDKEIDALAEQLRGGEAPEALAKLEALANIENRRALHQLGDLYAKDPLSVDGAKAVDYYLRAVAAGEKNDIIRLADLYRDGKVITADPAKALQYYRQAANLGNATGQVRLGSALIKGTLGQTDPDQGLELLEGLAEKDNINALQELGELYSKGPLPIDGIKAVSYYERAVAAGNIGALARLGDLYRDGNVVRADPAKALEYYQQALDQGNSTAQLRLGSALIKGTLGDTDQAKGLTLLEALAAQQDRWALHELGELYSKGPLSIDGIKAVGYYERAVAAGNTSTLVRLGDLYRDGSLVKADPARAISLYEQAHAAGQTSGLRNLAVSHTERRFGRLSQPTKGVKLLQEALKAGDLNAATALANVYFNGTSVTKDPQRGLKVLRQAAEGGNPSAARSLISVLRNGKGKELPRNLAKADVAMQKYAALFTQTDLELEQILLSAARADSPKEFEAIAAAMKEASPALQQRMLTMVRGSNQNAYAWLLQERLAELGLYKGRLNGIMNTATIRAVSAFCAQQDLRADCVQGPLHWTTASVLAANLYN